MKKTKEERKLLGLLEKGILDGMIGDEWKAGRSTCWFQVKEGVPYEFKEGPGGRFFNGKENENYSGKRHILGEWKTDEEKLGFLQKYGWLSENDEVRDYSAKFKP